MSDRAPRTEADGEPGSDAADVWVDIAASPEEVWTALTTEGGLAPWMGQGASIEPSPGGPVILPDPVGGATRRGRVERIDEGRRLDLTWWPALRPAERSTVSITVSPAETATGTPAGTRVRVVERPATRRPARAGAARLPTGLWSWRLAVLSVCGCLSRV